VADTESRIKHNFGMARPRLSKGRTSDGEADRFGLPVIHAGRHRWRYSGIGAEERGQAEAIARSTDACLSLVSERCGDRGEGDRACYCHRTANRVLMLEHAIYSVISPEGAASILWRDTTKAQERDSMKITAQDMVRFGIIDQHRSGATGVPTASHRPPSQSLAKRSQCLAELKGLDREAVRKQRRDKFSQWAARRCRQAGVYFCFTIG